MLPLWRILYDRGADLILAGHEHSYARYSTLNREANGVDVQFGMRQIVVGTGGKGLTTSTRTGTTPGLEVWQDASTANTLGVVKLTLHPGSYQWQFVPVAGKTFTDAGGTNCHGTPPPTTPTPTPGPDTDGDTIPDASDPDDDGDGFADTAEVPHIGTGSLDPCGTTGWPADLAGNDNAFNIGDMNTFLFPLRADGSFNKFDHPVPDANDPNIGRWNLQVDGSINIGDLNALNPAVTSPTSHPPMFGGQPAFFTDAGSGIGVCPYPP
jgi:hypothetical protein